MFPELIAKLQQVENPTRRNALATQIFGRSALELAPLLAMTKEDMDKLTKAAHDSGKVMGEEVVGKLQTFDDAIDAITQRVQGFVTQAVAGFISLPGPIQGAVLAIAGIAVVAGPIMQVIALLSTLKTAVAAASIAANIAKLSFIQAWIAAAGPLAPLIAAIAGVGLAVYAVIKYWEPIKAFFANLWKGIAGIFSAYVNWIISLPSKIAQGWGTLKTFFANLWKSIYDATVGQLGRIFAAIKNFLAHIFGLGGGSKAPSPPTPAAAGAAAGAKAGSGQPAVVRMSPDVEAAIKKTAANTKPQPRFA
jgi:phage-related protein